MSRAREIRLSDLNLTNVTLPDEGVKAEKPHKYHAEKTVVDGVEFASKLEARRYSELLLRQQAGEVFGLKLHTRWMLQPAFTDATGRKWQAIFYEDDFSYFEGTGAGAGTVMVVEDTKGVETEAYKIKRKLFLYRHPEVRFVEVRRDGNGRKGRNRG